MRGGVRYSRRWSLSESTASKQIYVLLCKLEKIKLLSQVSHIFLEYFFFLDFSLTAFFLFLFLLTELLKTGNLFLSKLELLCADRM